MNPDFKQSEVDDLFNNLNDHGQQLDPNYIYDENPAYQTAQYEYAGYSTHQGQGYDQTFDSNYAPTYNDTLDAYKSLNIDMYQPTEHFDRNDTYQQQTVNLHTENYAQVEVLNKNDAELSNGYHPQQFEVDGDTYQHGNGYDIHYQTPEYGYGNDVYQGNQYGSAIISNYKTIGQSTDNGAYNLGNVGASTTIINPSASMINRNEFDINSLHSSPRQHISTEYVTQDREKSRSNNFGADSRNKSDHILSSPLVIQHAENVAKNFEIYDLQQKASHSYSEPIIQNACNKCKNINSYDARFCSRCGARLLMELSPAHHDYSYQGEEKEQYSFDHITNEDQDHQLINHPSQQFVDPLGRSKGHAIAIFTVGKLITTFPKKQKRFEIDGDKQNMVEKVVCGTVSVRPVYEMLGRSITSEIKAHGGPLLGSAKTKLKKKDVILLIERRITKLRTAIDETNASQELQSLTDVKDLELFYMVLKLLIEHDGNLQIRKHMDVFLRLFFENKSKSGTEDIFDTLQHMLEQGKKMDALKIAIDSKLWAIAIILSSHISQDVYSETVNSFSLQSFGNLTTLQSSVTQYRNNPALCTLFSLLGGSKLHSFPPTCSSDSTWKEIFRMIMANRTVGDAIVLNGLGEILKHNLRVIPGHLCQMFSMDNFCSGLDSPMCSVVLFGVDHQKHPYSFYRDMQAIGLTEIYEYSQTLIGGLGYTNCLPHFLAYKIIYISYLIDLGYFDIASSYLESVESFIKNFNKGSSYLHQKLLETSKMLAELVMGRLPYKSEGVKDGGWLSKVGQFDTFMNVLDRGINTLMTNAVGLEAESKPKLISPAHAPQQPDTTSKKFPVTASNSTKMLKGSSSHGVLSTAGKSAEPTIKRNMSFAQPSNDVAQLVYSLQPPTFSSSPSKMRHPSLENSLSKNQPINLPPQSMDGRFSRDLSSQSSYQNAVDMRIDKQDVLNRPLQNRRSFPNHNITASRPPTMPNIQESYELANPQYPNIHSQLNSRSGAIEQPTYIQHPAHSSFFPSNSSQKNSLNFQANQLQSSITAESVKSTTSDVSNTQSLENTNGHTSVSTGNEINPHSMPKITNNFDARSYDHIYNQQPHIPSASDFPVLNDHNPMFNHVSYNQKTSDEPLHNTSVINSHTKAGNSKYDDDLGFGNKSLGHSSESEQQASPKAKEELKPRAASSSGWLGSWFKKRDASKDTSAPIKANMGEQNSFVYDPIQKRWVNKSANTATEEAKPTSPPPMIPTGSLPGTPSIGEKGAQNFRAGNLRGSKSRYVDIINPDSVNTASIPAFSIPGVHGISVQANEITPQQAASNLQYQTKDSLYQETGNSMHRPQDYTAQQPPFLQRQLSRPALGPKVRDLNNEVYPAYMTSVDTSRTQPVESPSNRRNPQLRPQRLQKSKSQSGIPVQAPPPAEI